MSHDLSVQLPVQSGRHPINVGHFVMGLAFVGILGIWALVQGDVVDGGDVRWLLPLPWVLAGIAGLLATTLSGRRASSHTGWVGQAPPAEPTRAETSTDNDTDDPTTEETR